MARHHILSMERQIFYVPWVQEACSWGLIKMRQVGEQPLGKTVIKAFKEEIPDLTDVTSHDPGLTFFVLLSLHLTLHLDVLYNRNIM